MAQVWRDHNMNGDWGDSDGGTVMIVEVVVAHHE